MLHGEKLVVYGGQQVTLPSSSSSFSSQPSVSFLSDVWSLDTRDWRWQRMQTTGRTLARNGHCSVVWRDAMYVIGGSDEDGPSAALLRLDLSSWAWSELKTSGDEVEGRELHAVALEEEAGRLWLVGGRSECGVLNSVYTLQLSSGEWRQVGKAPPRCAHSLLLMPQQRTASAEEKEQLSASLTSLPLTASASAAPRLPALLMLGGTDGLAFFNDVTIFLPPASSPQPSSLSPALLCPDCNGPAYWHRLGGGSKADTDTQPAPQPSSSSSRSSAVESESEEEEKEGGRSWSMACSSLRCQRLLRAVARRQFRLLPLRRHGRRDGLQRLLPAAGDAHSH